MELFKKKRNIIFDVLLILSITGFFLGLVAYAYMGSFMRLSGDDYCYAGVLKQHGFWSAQSHSYFNPMPFHGNRYSLTLLSTFFSLFPPIINGILPLITIMVFTLANYFLLQITFFQIRLASSKLFCLLFGMAFIFYTLLLTPTVRQSLYWRSAMLPTLAPLVGTILLIGLILYFRNSHWLWFIGIFSFSVLNAGLSENGTAFQATAGSLLLLVVLWRKLTQNDTGNSLLIPTIFMIIGSLIGMTIMWISPSIGNVMGEISVNLRNSFILSMTHTIDFIIGFFRSYYIIVTSVIIFGFSSYFLLVKDQKNDIKFSNVRIIQWIYLLGFAQIISFLLIFSIMFPSAFIRFVYPDPRHLIGAVLPMVFSLLFTGFCLAAIFWKISKSQTDIVKIKNYLTYSGAMMIFLISLLYPVRYISQITSERIFFEYWAYQWDRRHTQILDLVQAGDRHINVMALDKIIEDVGELGPSPGSIWYNLCAADYYQVDGIFADQPGWEEGFRDYLGNR